MANTTFSGPVRSQNGFQEWNGTAWVPVAGGGGSTTLVYLSNSSSFPGVGDNRYSTDSSINPPIGPTAGNIIQLPDIPVGASYSIVNPTGGSTNDCWALQVPAIAGTDVSLFASLDIQYAFIGGSGSYPVYTGLDTYVAYSSIGAPTNTLFVYGELSPTNALVITRHDDLFVPGFGNVAAFYQTTSAVFRSFVPCPDPYVYPYDQLLPPP
jgi:hypothetical protein